MKRKSKMLKLQRILKAQGFPVELASGEPDIVTSYSGELALPYIAPAVLGARTLKDRLVTIYERVPKSVVMKKFESSNIIQAAGCDFAHQGTVDLTENVLTPTKFKVNIELCKDEFLVDWESASMGASAMGKILPPNFQDFLLLNTAAKVAEAVEYNIWNGNSGLGGAPTLIDGWIKRINDASAFTASTSGITAVSKANVVTALREALDLVPQSIRLEEDMKIFVSPAVAQYYIQALGDSGYNMQYQVNDKPLNIDGYTIAIGRGMPSSRIVVARTQDLAFGTDLLSDMNQAKVIDMEDNDGSDNVRVIMKFKMGTQIGIRTDIGAWKTA